MAQHNNVLRKPSPAKQSKVSCLFSPKNNTTSEFCDGLGTNVKRSGKNTAEQSEEKQDYLR